VTGLSQQETAAQLNTTTKAIEMRIRRAKKKLTEALSDLAGEG
jgi:DNA-directed RNA polymerase specialized sigma24 family protein